MLRTVQTRGMRRKLATGLAVLVMTTIAAGVATSPAQASTKAAAAKPSHSVHIVGRTWLV